MNEGDRVRLRRDIFIYSKGAEGVVVSKPTQNTADVNIDKDHEGNSINPPYPLASQPTIFFEVI